MAQDKVTIQEAARRLGVKDDAIRKRIQRGTLRSEKAQDGRVYVYLDATHDAAHPGFKDSTQYAAHDAGREELVDVLRDEVAHLRHQLDQERDANRENRRIIAGLIERVPELEAPAPAPEPPRSPESAGEAPTRGTVPDEPQAPSSRPSLWHRIFGG